MDLISAQLVDIICYWCGSYFKIEKRGVCMGDGGKTGGGGVPPWIQGVPGVIQKKNAYSWIFICSATSKALDRLSGRKAGQRTVQSKRDSTSKVLIV